MRQHSFHSNSLRDLHVRILWTVLILALAGATTAPLASARPLNKAVAPLRVFLGAGGTVSHEEVIVGKKLWKHTDRYGLRLSLEEVQTGGGVVLLGEKEIPVSATRFVTENSATKQVVVDVEWMTGPVAAGSSIFACAQATEIRRDGSRVVVSDEECRLIFPEFDQ